jgi:hypothetical protein
MAETLNPHENGNCANRVLATVLFDDYFDDDDDYMERHEEEMQERASNCTCGAWKMSKNGEVFHVADCCCGAE